MTRHRRAGLPRFISQRVLVVGAVVVALAGPSVAHAASSLAVVVDPPIAGATPAVTFSMASDDPTVRFANAYARVDDGRACEPTPPAFESVSPGFLPLAVGVPFVSGVTTRQGARLKQPGAFRICGYLTGSTNNVSLATDDDVIVVRLPIGTARLTVTPAVPVFGEPVTVRATGSVDIPATIELRASAGACSDGEVVPSTFRLAPAGAFDLTYADVELPQDLVRLCLVMGPQPGLDAPYQNHLLGVLDQPTTYDLGATMTGLEARVNGRRLEATVSVTGRFRGSPTLSIEGAHCEKDRVEATIRADRATAVCHLAFGIDRRPRSQIQVRMGGTTIRGATLRTPALDVDVSAFLRTARLVAPGRSIGFVRIGMTLRELLDQGGRKSTPGFFVAKLILPGSRVLRPQWYAVEDVFALVREGRVRGILLREKLIDPYRTAEGLTPNSSPRRAVLLRRAPGARCRPLPANPALADLCLIGPSTYWGPKGTGAFATSGFFAIWPGAQVARVVVVGGRRVVRPGRL